MVARPTFLKFLLDPIEDKELTCFFCKTRDVDSTFTVRGGNEVRIIGVHDRCVEKHHERERPNGAD